MDLNGAYQLDSNDNFEAFLAAQGVPWALRSAANRLRPIHRFKHSGSTLTIQIQGIIDTQTTYMLEGPPVRNEVRGRSFEDRLTYLKEASVVVGLQTIKRAIDDGYVVTVSKAKTTLSLLVEW